MKMAESHSVTNEISTEEQRHYLKVKPKFTHGQNNASFCDAKQDEGIDFDKRTYQQRQQAWKYKENCGGAEKTERGLLDGWNSKQQEE
jgi:hypothetical protein